MILQIEQFATVYKETKKFTDEHDCALHVRVLEILWIWRTWKGFTTCVVLNLH
jgi:hypothetical protein